MHGIETSQCLPPGVSLPDGRPSEERQTLPEAAAAEHPNHYGARVAGR